MTESKEEENPKYKGGRWLARIEDLPEPVNEQTDQLKRILDKLQEITKNLSEWSIIHANELSPNPVLILTNTDGFVIKMQSFSAEEGEYYACWKQIEVLIDGIVIDHFFIKLYNVIWCSTEKKETKEAKIIHELKKAIDNINEDKKEKLRSQFYGNTNE